MQQVMHWKKGTVDICATSLVTAIMVNITKNGINETLSGCHVLYITRTHFLYRFRIWSQKSNIGSMSSVMGWFVMNGSLYGWFTHGKFSNRWVGEPWHPTQLGNHSRQNRAKAKDGLANYGQMATNGHKRTPEPLPGPQTPEEWA